MTTARTGAVSATGDGYITSLFEGTQSMVVPMDAGTFVAIVGPAGEDIERFAANIRIVPTASVAVRPIDPGHPIPVGTRAQYGDVAGNRFVGFAYTGTDGLQCVWIQIQGTPSIPHCTHSGHPVCPWLVDQNTSGAEPSIVAVVPGEPTAVEVFVGGQSIPTTTQQFSGFTLAFGSAPTAHEVASITVDGTAICPPS